jgi:hypothetical protein
VKLSLLAEVIGCDGGLKFFTALKKISAHCDVIPRSQKLSCLERLGATFLMTEEC